MHARVCGLAAAIALVGCARDHLFVCDSNDQCVVDNRPGVCEPNGACSFADPSCASGQRYGEFSAPGLADVCVGDEPDAGPGGSVIEVLTVTTEQALAPPAGNDRLLLVFALYESPANAVRISYGGVALTEIPGAAAIARRAGGSADLELGCFAGVAQLLDTVPTGDIVSENALDYRGAISVVLANVDQDAPVAGAIADEAAGSGPLATDPVNTIAEGLVVIAGVSLDLGDWTAPDYDMLFNNTLNNDTRTLATTPGTGAPVSVSVTFQATNAMDVGQHAVSVVSLTPATAAAP